MLHEFCVQLHSSCVIGTKSGPLPLTSCPKNNWLTLSESESSRQEDVYEIAYEMSYEIPILIFVAILFLIIVSSCLSICFHRINSKTPQLTAWAPIWARRKSSVFQASTNMRTWDLERNDMHPSDANRAKPIRSISEPSSEQFRRIMESPDFRAVIDSANLMHREKAQEHFQIEAKPKQIASDAKPSNPYDSVLQQLKTSFRMEAGSPRSPQNTS
jgi:hypothetical protein